jgi:hypothetical protein
VRIALATLTLLCRWGNGLLLFRKISAKTQVRRHSWPALWSEEPERPNRTPGQVQNKILPSSSSYRRPVRHVRLKLGEIECVIMSSPHMHRIPRPTGPRSKFGGMRGGELDATFLLSQTLDNRFRLCTAVPQGRIRLYRHQVP